MWKSYSRAKSTIEPKADDDKVFYFNSQIIILVTKMPLEEADLDDEQELEYLLKKDPEQIEKGLRVIANQVITPKGRIDLLCVDKEGVLTVVELKLDQDEDHLKQAINYYDWVFENMAWIRNTYHKLGISDEYLPKMILIARGFTDSVVTGAKYFNESFDIKLYRYKALRINDQKFVICDEIAVPTIPEFPEKPKRIDDHLNYITNDKVRKVCSETIEIIREIGQNIEATPLKWGISFKYKGKNFAALYPRRDAFAIHYKESDSWVHETGIRRIKRVQEIVDKNIKEAYKLVGGTVVSSPKEE